MQIVVSLLPVFVFLVFLTFIDSYKLVKPRSVMIAIAAGMLAACLSFLVNRFLMSLLTAENKLYPIAGSPVVEESLKAAYVVYLIRSRKVGFMVDAAISGFAVGAGFACIENIYYLTELGNPNLLLWIIRGFGTAVMHGGTTAIFGIISKNLADRFPSKGVFVVIPGGVAAIVIHASFNLFFLPPAAETLLMLVSLPLLLILVFKRSEQSTREWLGVGLDTDMEILQLIMTGNLGESNIGKYLHSLKEKFPGEIIADMLCLLRLHTELAVRSKGILMMREAGFKCTPDTETIEKFNELRYLEKSIGKIGKIAVMPIFHTTSRDLSQIYMLAE